MNDNRAGRLRIAAAGLGLLTCLVTAGCGGGYGNVSGKVTYNNQPLPGGNIIFYSEGEGTQTSPIGPDGSYKVEKVPAGTVKVAVETESLKPPAFIDPHRAAMPTPPPDKAPKDAAASYNKSSSPAQGKYVAIPPNYADPKQSGLTYDVKAGTQQKDFDLK